MRTYNRAYGVDFNLAVQRGERLFNHRFQACGIGVHHRMAYIALAGIADSAFRLRAHTFKQVVHRFFSAERLSAHDEFALAVHVHNGAYFEHSPNPRRGPKPFRRA